MPNPPPPVSPLCIFIKPRHLNFSNLVVKYPRPWFRGTGGGDFYFSMKDALVVVREPDSEIYWFR